MSSVNDYTFGTETIRGDEFHPIDLQMLQDRQLQIIAALANLAQRGQPRLITAGAHNLTADNQDIGGRWNFHGTPHNNDLIVITGKITSDLAPVIVPYTRIGGLTVGEAGTALDTASGFPLYSATATSTLRARIGRTAAGNILVDPEAADTTGRIDIWQLQA